MASAFLRGKGQQSLEIEVHVVLVGLSLKRVLIGHDKLAQTVYEWSEHLGETRQSLNNSSRRCAHILLIFSPPYLGLPMLIL